MDTGATAPTSSTPPAIYGPHCGHDECSWIECDLAAPPAPGVLYGCREQATCPYCGPTSPDWARIAAGWVRWCVDRYGSANSDELRAVDAIPANVVATAELVEAHPVRS